MLFARVETITNDYLCLTPRDFPESETETESEDILGETEETEETEDTESSEDESSESDENTALIPRSMLGDKIKPGDKMQVEIVHLYEDEAKIKLRKAKAEESDDMENSMRELEKYDKSSEMT